MKFLNDLQPHYDLTYNDVFLVPSFSRLNSRFDTDISPNDGTGATIPVVVANMMAVAGKRMAETVARRGGIVVLPQDLSAEKIKSTIDYVKSRDLIYETPLTLGPDNTIAEAMNIIHKRAHEAVVIIDSKNRPLGIFKEKDEIGHDRFTYLKEVMSSDLFVLEAGMGAKEMFNKMNRNRVSVAPVVKNGKMVGLISQKSALRTSIYKPAVDKKKRLLVAVAIGVNGDIKQKTQQMLKLGADILVLDTAHGHQRKMVEAIACVRQVNQRVKLVAGNVVTAEATKQLMDAGADIVKVGVGPGAMCTTRMMTGVGRPQFSAVMECAAEARRRGKHVWADGGVRHPRDVALALAAGASNVMLGSWFAGTYESVSDTMRDNQGRLYKENYGMASKRAVQARSQDSSKFELMRRELFEEGISSSRLYIDEQRPGVEDIIDQITAGLRSSMSYAGAKALDDFYQKAVVGIQSAAGYQEGMPVPTSWQSE